MKKNHIIIIIAVMGIAILVFGYFALFGTSQFVTRTPRQTMQDKEGKTLQLPLTKPEIIIYKSERRLDLFDGGQLVRTYKIALGSKPTGDKEKEGDRRTPEGSFYVCNKNPKSRYHLSLGLSYPNEEDAARGLRDGLINQDEHDRIVSAIRAKQVPPWNTALGGEIFIHGEGAGRDWTWGCIALENEDIEELFDAIPVPTPVTIKP